MHIAAPFTPTRRGGLGVKIAYARKRKAPIADQRSGKLIIVHEETSRRLLVTARP